MKIKENVKLAEHSTMRLGGKAQFAAEIKTIKDIQEAWAWAQSRALPVIMVGRGSNIVWRDEGFGGLLLINKIVGRLVLVEDAHAATVKIGAGENWDKTVEWTVKKKLSGIEFMSLIPGTAGAAPVQNVGAYGGELNYTLVELEAFDTKLGAMVKLQNHDCGFSYRSSRFKTTDHGRFFIISITLHLKKDQATPPFYESLQKYFDQHGVTDYSPKNIRKAVIKIRQSKLPDPEKVSNNGSFFTNPIIEASQFVQLQKQFPDIKAWPTKAGQVKVSAGWLLEKAGFKGVHDQQTGMATWPAQALVLVNEKAKTTNDLLTFKSQIVAKIEQMFSITLVQEPELLP